MNSWANLASLLARAAGLSHDIGKATVHFQEKLRGQQSALSGDRIRHEWISVRVLETWRGMMRAWQKSADAGNAAPPPTLKDAWHVMADDGIERLPAFMQPLQQGHRMIKQTVVAPVCKADDVVDFAVMTHHGLLGPTARSSHKDRSVIPMAETHVRPFIDQPVDAFKQMPSDTQGFPESLESALWDVLQRIDADLPAQEHQQAPYWKGLGMIVRMALIAADHQVSSRSMAGDLIVDSMSDRLYANTKPNNNGVGRKLDQPLDWHLEHVGQEAASWVEKLAKIEGLAGLSTAARARLHGDSTESRFAWQRDAVNHIRSQYEHPEQRNTPRLVLNAASTGTGKTRANLMIADAMTAPEAPLRISIGLNLRSLTLQTGEAICADLGLPRQQVATVMGDAFLKAAHDTTRAKLGAVDEDEDETDTADGRAIWEIGGNVDPACPKWVREWAETYGGCRSEEKTCALLGTPLLVSTLDYLIDAGNPGRQGHHVTAALRVAGSDLILDEIDNYSPQSLGAVMRLIEMAALLGCNVIVSSATLTQGCAAAVVRAFEAGAHMHGAINHHSHVGCHITLVDNYQSPSSHTGASDEIEPIIAQWLDGLADHLHQEPCYRLAYIQTVAEGETPIDRFQHSISAAIQQLHHNHAWLHPSGKRVSFGVVRVANIEPCVEIATRLQSEPGYRVSAYHSEDFRLRRWVKESALDRLFNRKRGNEHIFQDAELDHMIRQAPEEDLVFVVVATPVEEVGRDHDFDWSVIEPSSTASIVQIAGRVNRHRRLHVQAPNIAILDRNLRSLKGCADCFRYPGNANIYTHNDQSMAALLAGASGWQAAGLVITPTLVFGHNGAMCALAQDDQNQAKRMLAEAEAQVITGCAPSKTALAWLTRRHYIDFNLRHDPQPTVRFRARYDRHQNLYFEIHSPALNESGLARDWAEWHVTEDVEIRPNDKVGCWDMLSPSLDQLPRIAAEMGLDEHASMEISLRDQDGVTFVIDECFGRAKSVRL